MLCSSAAVGFEYSISIGGNDRVYFDSPEIKLSYVNGENKATANAWKKYQCANNKEDRKTQLNELILARRKYAIDVGFKPQSSGSNVWRFSYPANDEKDIA
jgi:hypothetical protein